MDGFDEWVLVSSAISSNNKTFENERLGIVLFLCRSIFRKTVGVLSVHMEFFFERRKGGGGERGRR